MSSRNWLAVLPFLALAAAAAPARAADDDSDGLSTSLENATGTDPSDASTDEDGWTDFEFFEHGTDPNERDSDGDTVDDSEDSAPLEPPTGDLDGVSQPTNPSASQSPYALSGETPQGGVQITVTDGALHRTFVVPLGKGRYGGAFPLWYGSRWTIDALVGRNWFSLLDVRYVEDGNGDVRIVLPPGFEYKWVKNGGSYVKPWGHRAELEKDGEVFLLTYPEGVTWTLAAGKLDKVEDRYAVTILDLAYQGGSATSVTDSRGQSATFAYYSGTGRLKSVTTADNRTWYFRYNPRAQLLRVEGPATATVTGGIWWEWHYTTVSSDPDLNNDMVTAYDGQGNAWLKVEHDESDRVTKQVVGGTDAFTFVYSDAANHKTTVKDRALNERVWEWEATAPVRKQLTEKTNRGVRSGEGDYVTSWTHDGAGYLSHVPRVVAAFSSSFPRLTFGSGTRWRGRRGVGGRGAAWG